MNAQICIEKVIGTHEGWQRPDRSWECACGETFGIKLRHTQHVAAAVLASLPDETPVGQVPTEGACHDPQHDCVDDCPQCGPGALRERIASAAVAVMVGSPHIVKGKVSQIAWDVAHEVVNRIDLSGLAPEEQR